MVKAEDCKSSIPGSNPGVASIFNLSPLAGVAEQADARDLKSLGHTDARTSSILVSGTSLKTPILSGFFAVLAPCYQPC